MEETTAEKIVRVVGKTKPKPKSDGLGKLKSHLDKGEEFILYSVAHEEENTISHVGRRVSVSINGSCEEWAKEKAKKDEPTTNEPNDNRPPMSIGKLGDLLDEGKAFLIMKDSDGDYVIHEITEVSGNLTLVEPINEWLVIALGEFVDEHPGEEYRENWWLEGGDSK